MATMREIKRWGEEAEAIVKARLEAKKPKQKITYGNKTIYVERDKPINMADFES